MKVELTIMIIIKLWEFGLMMIIIIINRCWKCELMIMIMMRFWKLGLMIIINNNKWMVIVWNDNNNDNNN